jgi:hypothetical protein
MFFKVFKSTVFVSFWDLGLIKKDLVLPLTEALAPFSHGPGIGLLQNPFSSLA